MSNINKDRYTVVYNDRNTDGPTCEFVEVLCAAPEGMSSIDWYRRAYWVNNGHVEPTEEDIKSARLIGVMHGVPHWLPILPS